MSRIHIRNIYCLLTSYDEPYQRGVDVRINGNTIEKIGTDLPVEEGYDVVDGRGCVVTPGFVNTHHHFYQTLTRNVPEVQDAKLFDWLVHLYEIWKKLDEDAGNGRADEDRLYSINRSSLRLSPRHQRGSDGNPVCRSRQAGDALQPLQRLHVPFKEGRRPSS